jgi:hypothetical protein
MMHAEGARIVAGQRPKKTIGRRGALSVAVAAASAALAALSQTDKVEAADGNALTIGQANTGSNTTLLQSNVAGWLGSLRVTNSAGVAIMGVRSGSSAEPAIRGEGTAGDGVHGQTTSGFGVFGKSTNNNGVVGQSSGANAYGIAGIGDGQAHGLVGISYNQVGLSGQQLNGNSWAGAFYNFNGPLGLFVQGDLVVTGQKSSGFKTQRHGMRRLYAVESTECWFEDIGRARLVRGKVRVELDEVFLETVNTGRQYIVSLTPLDSSSKGLAITNQDATGFDVAELWDGTGTYPFTYRVSVKVRGEEARRLQEITPPTPPPLPRGFRQ